MIYISNSTGKNAQETLLNSAKIAEGLSIEAEKASPVSLAFTKLGLELFKRELSSPE